jgi:hypothetical protein
MIKLTIIKTQTKFSHFQLGYLQKNKLDQDVLGRLCIHQVLLIH